MSFQTHSEWNVQMRTARGRSDGRQWVFSGMFFSWYIRNVGKRSASYRQGLPNHSNGGYIMAIVRYMAGGESDEVLEALRAEVRDAAKRPYTYDPDCPLLTEEQLAEFRPVNYATNEERLAAMREAVVALTAEKNEEALVTG